jgi:hypothetical protein
MSVGRNITLTLNLTSAQFSSAASVEERLDYWIELQITEQINGLTDYWG